MTVVFCDLVGFTSRAESLDPEDVEAILRPFHERVRSELERHGGTVEKFIGDAVMALFGAPTAHEDDPERAVRAALAIRDYALEEGLELRVGVTTGEALVSLDAHPAGGEGMASGDVVNSAARLQAAAPVNGILVSEATQRATRDAVDYEEALAVEAKGKSEPVAAWRATAARSRFGVDVSHHARAELVGRERELSILPPRSSARVTSAFPQLVTLVAVPGIGKSRLVSELRGSSTRARTDHLAPGQVPRLRRRRCVLGARGGGEGAGGHRRARQRGRGRKSCTRRSTRRRRRGRRPLGRVASSPARRGGDGVRAGWRSSR